MVNKQDTNESYYVDNIEQLDDPIKVMRFMVMFFKIYDNHYFDVFKMHDLGEIHRVISDFDEFIRKSLINYNELSDLTGQVKTKESKVLDLLVSFHGELVNLHLGYTSLDAIENKTDEQLAKFDEIRKRATILHHILVNAANSIRNSESRFSKKKVFFTEEEHEGEFKPPEPSRRERRKKKSANKT
jgi:hypothetical protein